MSWAKEHFLSICFLSAVSPKHPVNPWRSGLQFGVSNTSRSLALFLRLQYNAFFFLEAALRGKQGPKPSHPFQFVSPVSLDTDPGISILTH